MKLFSVRGKAPGLPPGSVVYTGVEREEPVRLEVARYAETFCDHETDVPLERAAEIFHGAGVKWLNMIGIHNARLVEDIGAKLGIHPLVQEDVVNTRQRPKFEEYDGQIYVVARMFSCGAESGEVNSEQVSFILGSGWLALFQEREGDVFATVRRRIDAGTGRLRRSGADYLLYTLLDAIVDGYFAVVEKLGDRIEILENEIITGTPKESSLHQVLAVRKELIMLRKAIWPLREAVHALHLTDSPLIKAETRLFIRDIYDHTVQLMDTVESCRDLVSGLHDMYMSAVGNRMNEVMKVLTIIATIFIPITFIAGVYGMNFDTMPELHVVWGYPAALAAMLAVTVGMLCYFRRKEWI